MWEIPPNSDRMKKRTMLNTNIYFYSPSMDPM